MAGPKGYVWAGLIGGLISSTNVTLTFSRISRREPGAQPALAAGIAGASFVMYLRIAAASAVLDSSLAAALLRYTAIPALLGALVSAMLARAPANGDESSPLQGNPLQLSAALQMGALFQGVILAVNAARGRFGAAGLLVSAAVLGLTDMDALTLSMVKAVQGGEEVPLAAKAIG
jgi:uncharacterized membrane protein (DUF4010 family)